MPFFNERLIFLIFFFDDESVTICPSLDKMGERKALMPEELNAMMAIPPKDTHLGQVHRNMHFYQDMAVVGTTIFLVRDRVIILMDSFTKEVENKFFSKQRVIGLYKLKQMTDDADGYKDTQYKVVVVLKSGELIVFTPENKYLQKQWTKQTVGSNLPGNF